MLEGKGEAEAAGESPAGGRARSASITSSQEQSLNFSNQSLILRH